MSSKFTLKELIIYNNLINSNNLKNFGKSSEKYLKRILPICFKDQIKILNTFPEIDQVRYNYYKSVNELSRFDNFSLILSGIIERHRFDSYLLSKRFQKSWSFAQDSINNFLLNELENNLLMKQHIILFEKKEKFIQEISLKNMIEKTYNIASSAGSQYYDTIPDCILKTEDITMTYIPEHLSFIFMEAFKNSIKASKSDNIEIRFIKEQQGRITIKISDKGCGFSMINHHNVFKYGYSTGRFPDRNPNPISGFGYGLSLIRLHTRLFGGDTYIYSKENVGTDLYCSFPNIKF